MNCLSNAPGSVDKRDAMRLHKDTREIVVALHKEIEVIFTGLGVNNIAKMQRYL